eukprot:1531225-Amphidinium_carterae.1
MLPPSRVLHFYTLALIHSYPSTAKQSAKRQASSATILHDVFTTGGLTQICVLYFKVVLSHYDHTSM